MNGEVCPHHGVLQFKVEQTFTKIEAIERKTDAILAAVALIETHNSQIADHSRTLFDPDRDAGIVAEVRQLKEDKVFRTKAWAAILTFITGNLALLYALYNSIRTSKGG